LSNVYLIRHGQAGTRDNYDTLSELGREQSRRLGEHFVSLRRQQETAVEVRCVYLRRGSHFPEVDVRSQWNEFDLDHVYRGTEFRAGYEQMREEMLTGPAAAIHRRWTPCDMKVVESGFSDVMNTKENRGTASAIESARAI
jgi:broad specificity phosphatase PhoE